MTVETVHTVLALLEDDPLLRVYHYRHAQTGHILYAVFPRGQYDDMATSPAVAPGSVLLYTNGQWTAAGARWLAQYRGQEVPWN